MAFANSAIFLRMNGYRLEVHPDDGETFLVDQVIQEKTPIEDIVGWLESRMKHVEKATKLQRVCPRGTQLIWA